MPTTPRSVSFTRPADTTAYASGDLVANSTTAGSVIPLVLQSAVGAGGQRLIRRMRVRKSGTSVTNASFRIHLYGSYPTPANGDNGAWSTSGAAAYLGAMDVTIDRAFTDGAVGVAVPVNGFDVSYDQGEAIYALVEARGAYTPASGETFTLEAEVLVV